MDLIKIAEEAFATGKHNNPQIPPDHQIFHPTSAEPQQAPPVHQIGRASCRERV